MSTVTPAPASAPDARRRPRRQRQRLLTRRDLVVLAVMVGIPALWHLAFVWFPALASVVLSFTSWDGIGGFSTITPVGLENYRNIVTIYPPFWPAIAHNVLWLLFFIVVATPFGILLAVLLDKELAGTRFYQSALYLPVVLSLVVIGFIAQLVYAPEQGLLNNVLGRTEPGRVIDWLGNPRINLWAVLVMASWRHAGYIMILYLAGLKSVDPTLREAAAIDGASGRQTFFRVVFPVLKPINIVVLVITVIESLRAFDIVYVINKGTNGLELLSILITNNIIGEASRIGFGSALAVILLVVSLGAIIPYLYATFRKEEAT
ncbi:MAG TPA: sugar ABC transporter permease [Euzebyales bacterium]|nr:sugar ABC transporter permease [Euzebyales bacterium]